MRFLFVAVFAGICTVGMQHTPTLPNDANIAYDEFMKLAPQARGAKFQELSAEEKARFKRTHAERWLARNRGQLSQAQIAATEQAIAFVTPDIYRNPDDPEVVKEEQKIKHNLTCALGRDEAREAFALDAPPRRSTAVTWRSKADLWLSWFSDCLVR